MLASQSHIRGGERQRNKEKEADMYKRDKIRSYLEERMEITYDPSFFTPLPHTVFQSKMDYFT